MRDPKSNFALSSSCGDVSSVEPLRTLICNFCLIA